MFSKKTSCFHVLIKIIGLSIINKPYNKNASLKKCQYTTGVRNNTTIVTAINSTLNLNKSVND